MVLCPRLTFVCFAVAAQNMYLPTYLYQLSQVNQALCLLRKQLPLRHSNDMPARPGAFSPKNDRVGVYCEPRRFSNFCFNRGRVLRILPGFAKNGALSYDRCVYSHYYRYVHLTC